MARMDWEKAKRRDLTTQPHRDTRKQQMQRETAMAKFVAKHDLSCFKCGLSEGAVGRDRREWSRPVGDLRQVRARQCVTRDALRPRRAAARARQVTRLDLIDRRSAPPVLSRHACHDGITPRIGSNSITRTSPRLSVRPTARRHAARGRTAHGVLVDVGVVERHDHVRELAAF
jgi:hypothetical protein